MKRTEKKDFLRKQSLRFFTAILLGFLLFSCIRDKAKENKLAEFFQKDTVTILVTDSGLGGLSIAADVARRLKEQPVFKSARVIFFNAQMDKHTGYNDMKTTRQKVQIFNNALQAMNREFHPDLLLIACNTLSVLYDQTAFSRQAAFPVKGIVQTGAELIERNLKKVAHSKVIIFATQTTVRQGKHKALLMANGIEGERIVTQACPHLAGSIERGPHSAKTVALVQQYVDSALHVLNDDHSPLFVSYNCTHYGYVDDVFRKAFEEKGRPVEAFLNPNPFMANFLFEQKARPSFKHCDLTVTVVSQPELSPNKIDNISNLIAPISAQTAEALKNYVHRPHFFEWKTIAGQR